MTKQIERLIHLDFNEVLFNGEIVETNVNGLPIYKFDIEKSESVISLRQGFEGDFNSTGRPIFRATTYDQIQNAFVGGQGGFWFYDETTTSIFFTFNPFQNALINDPNNIGFETHFFLIARKRSFFSDFQDIVLKRNPLSSDGASILYENRLKRTIRVDKDLSDSLFGILSVSTSRIELENSDAFMERFLTATKTLKGGAITVFERENRSSSFKIKSSAPIRNLSFNKRSISVELGDFDFGFNRRYSALSSYNIVGDAPTWIDWLGFDTSSFGTRVIVKDHSGLPISHVIGQFNPAAKTGFPDSGISPALAPVNSFPYQWRIEPTDLIQCANIEDVSTVNPGPTNENRIWGVCVCEEVVSETNDFFFVNDVPADTTRANVQDSVQEILRWVQPGEWVRISSPTTSNVLTRCMTSWNGNIYFEPKVNHTEQTYTGTMQSFVVPVVYVEQNSVRYEIPPSLYTASFDTSLTGLPTGKALLKITFNNNFEGSVSGLSALNAETVVYARVRNLRADKFTVIDFLQELLEESGYEIDAQSFADARSFYDPDMCLTYLMNQSYQELIELCLESLFAFILLNNKGEIELKFHAKQDDESFPINNAIAVLDSESFRANYDDQVTSFALAHVNANTDSYGHFLKCRIVNPLSQNLGQSISQRSYSTIIAPRYCLSVSSFYGSPLGTGDTNSDTFGFDVRTALRLLRSQASLSFKYMAKLVDEDESLDVSKDIIINNSKGFFQGQRLKTIFKRNDGFNSDIEAYSFQRLESMQVITYYWHESGSFAYHRSYSFSEGGV